MIKSLIIKLRRKPKVVRENLALTGAGIFTFLVFSVWAFTVPDRFLGNENTQSASMFSTLKEEISDDAPNLSEITSEFREVVATTTEEVSDGSEELIFEDSTIEIDLDSTPSNTENKPIRIATTSHATSS